jgi:predicted phage terminase large subunit-like protein
VHAADLDLDQDTLAQILDDCVAADLTPEEVTQLLAGMGIDLNDPEWRAYLEAVELVEAEDLSYDLCEQHLHHFVKAAWHLVEPGVQFKDNWHIRVICRLLEQVIEGSIKRLLINIPYRTSKSTIVSVLWPVWAWIKKPSHRFLTGSHGAQLATRDALRSRRLIESPWFQARWSSKFAMTTDQNTKTRYENDKTGYRIAFGMTAGVTGEGGDTILIDDPHSAKTAMFSKVEREHALEVYDQELSTRLNDPDKSSIVIVMQRLHESDLCGHLLKKGGWVHLRIPMRFEPSEPCVIPELVDAEGNPWRDPEGATHPDLTPSSPWRDPRSDENQLMWPKRFNDAWFKEQERNLGSFGVAAQLQQRPAPLEGGMINLTWFRRFGAAPAMSRVLEVVQFWDTASKAKELINAPWVCGTWLRTEEGFYLVRVLREWMTYPQGKRAVVSEYEWAREQFAAPHALVIEDKSTGSSLLQELREDTTLPLLPFEPDADKVTRLGVESPAIEAGNVWLPEQAAWINDYEREMINFPNSDTMDQADMTSMALRYFREGANIPRIREL